jgi:hypothetical protein
MAATDPIGIFTIIALVAAVTVYGFKSASAAPAPAPAPPEVPELPEPAPAPVAPIADIPELLGGRVRKNTFRRRRGVMTRNVRRTRHRKNRANRSH